MNILTENDITGPVAGDLRRKIGLSQAEFWGRIGVSQSAGSNIETAARNEVLPVWYRRLIFLEYVAGIVTAADTEENAARLLRLGAVDSKSREIGKAVTRARKELGRVKSTIDLADSQLAMVSENLPG